MTWQEFKAAVEAAGVRDTDEIGYMDCLQGHDGIEVIFREQPGAPRSFVVE